MAEEERTQCPYQDECFCIKPEHKHDHEFVRSAMRVMAKLEDIKWSALKALFIGLAFLLVGVFGVGVISKLKELVFGS